MHTSYANLPSGRFKVETVAATEPSTVWVYVSVDGWDEWVQLREPQLVEHVQQLVEAEATRRLESAMKALNSLPVLPDEPVSPRSGLAVPASRPWWRFWA